MTFRDMWIELNKTFRLDLNRYHEFLARINADYEIIKKLAKTDNKVLDKAMSATGGIDFNAGNFDLQIKRDAKGAPLEFAKQDMAQIGNIKGFVPRILEIRPAINLPIFSELRQRPRV